MEGTPSGAVKNSKWVFEEEGGGRRKESVVSVCVRVCLYYSTLWMDVYRYRYAYCVEAKRID